MHRHKGGQLGAGELAMLALGTAVGGTYFLGVAIPLRAAGAGALIAFLFGGVLIYIILTALAEMTIANPAHGSFREYVEQAYGPQAGFVIGWVYWLGLVLAVSSEATAASIFIRTWIPAAPLWLLSLIIIASVTAVNALDVRGFTRIESLTAAVKLLALALFIIFVFLLAFGVPGGRPPGAGLLGQSVFAGGWSGIGGSMLLVMLGYGGCEVLGLAAPDARDPARTVPRAIVMSVIGLVVLYIGGVLALVLLLPPGTVSENVSPLVAALDLAGWPRWAGVMNAVVMSASLSQMLAAMYGLSRMLYSLAQEGQAPRIAGRLTRAGVPRNALFFSGGTMLVGVVLAWILPGQVYRLLTSSGGFAILFAYLGILASQLRFRAQITCTPATCRMPGYPYSTWMGIAMLLLVIASMPLVPGQGAGLVTGLALLAITAAASVVVVRRRVGDWEGGAREPEEDRIPLK